MTTDFSNTAPESPLAQVDAAALREQRAAHLRSLETGATLTGPALSEAMSSPVAAERLHHRLVTEGAPLIEEDPGADLTSDDTRLVTFLHRPSPGSDTVTSVHVVGMLAHNGSRTAAPTQHLHAMTLIPGTDLWGLTVRARRDLRTIYTIHVSEQTGGVSSPWEAMGDSVPDRLNPRVVADSGNEPARVPGFRRDESVLELDRAPHAALGLELGLGDHGDTGWTRHWFHSDLMDNTRRIWSWQPTGPADLRGVLVLHDGYDWTQRTRVAAILGELTRAGAIPPMLALAVEALRGLSVTELGCNDGFTDAVVGEVLPWARHHWPVPDDPERVVLCGQSWGGLNVLYSALRHPGAATRILSQSGSFWYSPTSDPFTYGDHGWLIEQFRDLPRTPGSGHARLRFHLQVGSLEGDMVTVNRHMRDVLLAAGHAVTWAETNDDHSWWSWQFSLVDGLRTLTSDW